MLEQTSVMGDSTPRPDQTPSKFQITDQDTLKHLKGLSLSDDATLEPGTELEQSMSLLSPISSDGDDERAVIGSNTGILTPETYEYPSSFQDTDQDSYSSLKVISSNDNTPTETDQEPEQPTPPALSSPGHDEMKLANMSSGTTTPPHSINSDLDDLLESIKITTHKADINKTLIKVSTLLNNSQDNKAEQETLQALEKAQALNLDDTVIARINHWLGRIAYFRHNDAEAHRYFLEARPCLNDRSCTEARELPVYLSLLQQGVTEEEREEILARYVRTITPRHGRGACSADSENRSMKRKGLHPTGSSAPKIEPGDTRPKASPRTTKTAPTTTGLALSYDKRKFTFRVYPTGLAPRVRKAVIFDKQPWEKGTMMSARQWEIVKQKCKNVPMTMNALAEERKRFLQVVRRIYYPDLC